MTATGMDLLDAQNTTTSDDSVVGTHVPAPSPRQSTQSPATHHLQQTLCNNASEQAHRFDSSSSARLNDSGDAASAFSAFDANNSPTIVETAHEGNSDDGDGWPKGEGLAGNLDGDDDAQVNLIPRSSGACDKIGTAHDSGLQSVAVNAAENLVIDRNNPGQGDFVMSVGALGNASGTPPDGSQNVSFGEHTVDEQRDIDGDKRPEECEGMIACSGSESSTSYNAPTGFDPSDPTVRCSRIFSLDLLSRALAHTRCGNWFGSRSKCGATARCIGGNAGDDASAFAI